MFDLRTNWALNCTEGIDRKIFQGNTIFKATGLGKRNSPAGECRRNPWRLCCCRCWNFVLFFLCFFPGPALKSANVNWLQQQRTPKPSESWIAHTLLAGLCNAPTSLESSVAVPTKLALRLPYNSAFALFSNETREVKTYGHTKPCPGIFIIVALLIIAQTVNNPNNLQGTKS